MEIRIWLYYMFVNYIIVQCLDAKSVSLNEIIAAEEQERPEKLPTAERSGVRTKPISSSKIVTESQDKGATEKATSKFAGLSKRFSFLKNLPLKTKIRKRKAGNAILGDKILSPLSYRKKFQIKSPLKPKKLILTQTARYKTRNQNKKREINGNENLKYKYIPLLKSISMLFDSLLNSDSSESYEITGKKYKRHKLYSDEEFEVPHNCTSKFNTRIAKLKSQKKTITSSPSFSFDVSSETKNFPSGENHDYGTFRSYRNTPILLPRNTTSFRRVDHGPSKTSSPAFHGNVQRNITRNHGDYEYNTGQRENEPGAESDENATYSDSRNDTSRIRLSGTDGDRHFSRNSTNREKDSYSQDKSTDDNFRKNQYETRRNETESEVFVREPHRRLRGLVYTDKISEDERSLSETIRPKEICEECILSTSKNSASDKRITNEDGPPTTKDETVSTRNETVILIEKAHRLGNYSQGKENKAPVVLIFDGYSVTRDKNGKNKVAGKTIHIRS